MSFLEIQDICFSYRPGQTILENLSLSVQENQRLALRGHNGSGKTTLFRVIMGLLVPQSGTISLMGKVLQDEQGWAELRSRIGMVFQDPDDQLFCPTLLDDVAFGPLNSGLDKNSAKELSMEVLRSLGIEDLANCPPYTLSGGQKKLGSLATVLSMKPSFLLLDEPSAGLDQNATDRLVLALKDFPGGYLISSHDRNFIEKVTDGSLQMNLRQLIPG
nr:energy-coupling factor ABC transporter ATP-binding protein [uncultured Dethiosulfovibrio sp.]